MDIAEPVEKAAALHVDAGEKTKIVVETEVHTNSDSLKRRHSTELKPENNAKKLKTSNNGESVEEDDDNDLIAKLDAIPAPVLNKEITKPADLLKKLEEDGKRDDLLERMERIVEGKSLANSTRQTETDEAFMAKLEEATKPKEEPKKVTEEKKASESPQKAAEVNDKPKEESKKVEEIKKDVPKPEEVRKEEPKPEVKVDKVEKMEVDGEKPSPTKKPTKEKNDENVISSTTGSASSAPKAVEAKNLPADTANIPSQKSPEVTSMGDVKQDVKVNAKDKTSVAEKSEPVKEMKDAEATPMKSSSDEKVLDSGKVQKQRNGVLTSIDIASTTLDEKDVKAESTDAAERGDKTAADAVAISNGKDAGESLVKESVYEVNFCFEENEIKYLYIDKVDKDGQKSDDAPSTSSNGDKTVSQSGESGSKEATEKFAVPALPKSTVTIKGISSLCSFIVERMREFSPEEEAEEMGKKKGKSLGTKSATSTPKSQKSTPVAAKASTSSRRVSGKTATPVAKESPATKAVSGVQEGKVGYAVMARWVDKMYYAGRVSAEKSGGKFAIHFADGALKTLNRDQIVFGHGDLLPFLDQSVHALVEGDTYEPGLVTEVTMDQDEQVLYTVVTESKTVVRTASDIYLEEDQAKNLQAAIKKDPQTGLMDLSTAKRVRRESSASESEASGRKVGRKSDPKEAEAGFSGGDAKKGRRGKRAEVPPAAVILNESQSSDLSDIPDTETVPQSPDASALEAIDGVQPELQKTAKEIDRMRRWYFDECLKNGRSLDDVLGPVPLSRSLFRNKSFILTITSEGRGSSQVLGHEGEGNHVNEVHRVPFFKDHLTKQIEAGGGKVYNYWEDVPKAKYASCKLIAPFSCTTAKYVQCLATGIHAISHEWIIESCRSGRALEVRDFILPAGWSIIERRFIQPTVRRVSSNSKAFVDLNILLVSENSDFTDFWTRVCKLAGASSVQRVKSVNDISTIQKGFLLVGGDVSPILIEKAKDFNISVVSTVWVVQSLIAGTSCDPNAHEGLTKMFTDDC